MSTIPTPPPQLPGIGIPTPSVYVAPAWEYKYLVRSLPDQGSLGEQELNALGAEGWELAGLFGAASQVHYYFKRELR